MPSPFPGMNPYLEHVELDLLRGGPRLPMEDLPPIPIPLLTQERAVLDLQSALHQVYDAAGYEDYIYAHQPDPPLQGADVERAQRLVAGDGASNG